MPNIEKKKTYPSTATRHRFLGIKRRKEAFSLIDSDRALNCNSQHMKQQEISNRSCMIQSHLKLNNQFYIEIKTNAYQTCKLYEEKKSLTM